jgi:hypothetical protein
MTTSELPPAVTPLDELGELELDIAQRADELMRRDSGQHSERDFWQEAEAEIWSARVRSPEPALAR